MCSVILKIVNVMMFNTEKNLHYYYSKIETLFLLDIKLSARPVQCIDTSFIIVYQGRENKNQSKRLIFNANLMWLDLLFSKQRQTVQSYCIRKLSPVHFLGGAPRVFSERRISEPAFSEHTFPDHSIDA